MTIYSRGAAAPSMAEVGAVVTASGRLRALRLIDRPVVLFVLLSCLFGIAAIIVNPPLCGPDEAAHFLRVYGIAQGDIAPLTRNEQGRRGVMIPARLRDDVEFFDGARKKLG